LPVTGRKSFESAEEFIFGLSWDTKSSDDNHLVTNIKLRILAETFVPKRLVTAIIAVMAWTDGGLPNSWHLALTQLPGPRELLLRSFFSDFSTPHRNPI